MNERPAMPDVTKVQLIALVQAILAVAVAFGAPISDTQSAALLGLAGAIAIVLPLADAAIRRGRARIYESANLLGPPELHVDGVSARDVEAEQLAAIEREAELERQAQAANGEPRAPGEYPPAPAAEPEPPQLGPREG